MKDLYALRKMLLRFGCVIYSGNPLADLELMDDELTELYQVNMITKEDWLAAKQVIIKEKEKITRG